MTQLAEESFEKPREKFLKDYQKPDFSVESVDLVFELHETQTTVETTQVIKRCTDDIDTPLKLNGERLKLISVTLNDQELSKSDYQLTNKYLILKKTPNSFTLKTKVEINPSANTFLDGLYLSKGIFCTQNEPEGFRKITYFLDRPDVMTSYTTKIIADRDKCPVLLSNGNRVEYGKIDEKRHYVVYKDPFKKPSYLFALVAGKLECIESEYIRASGKPVKLQIFCEKGYEEQCEFAMESLKKSMKWDEEVYGLEYDLDIFMIAAIEAFNAGAMENKGLNIFNISCLLANKKTATDDNFIYVEKVVAHEYFHNWTGDRVTCRDWFQLTLKEGLTVFRDQEFTSDMHSRSVHRIENVKKLKAFQFPEDAGPLAHPIRPKSYIEMNNFYTSTVYDKGSEIIRMVYTLIGKEAFFKGMKKYFELFDGKAVTCEDFIHAMELGSSKDLSQFRRWYEQKGTPQLKVSYEYSPQSKTFTLNLEQSNLKEGKDAPPLHFPLKMALLDPNGSEYQAAQLIEMKEKTQSHVFEHISEKPFLSINRDFSAPINIISPHTLNDLLFLMAHDSNDFNRFESAERAAMQLMQQSAKNWQTSPGGELNKDFLEAFDQIIQDEEIDYAFKALILTLPSESLMGQSQKPILFLDNKSSRDWMIEELANFSEERFLEIYHKLNAPKDYIISANEIGKRKLKNLCLSYLSYLNKDEYLEMSFKQFQEADNLTDQFSALSILNRVDCPQRTESMNLFYDQWKSETLVITKWFSLQALCPFEGALARLERLTKDPAFNYKVPNLVRALIGSFFENHVHFHALDGSGYVFAAEQISHIDQINPSVAARLSSAFRKYPKLDEIRKEKMKASLEKLLSKKGLSRNAYEIIHKSLNTE